MRVLLTGASGQLGAYLLDQLLRDGHAPIAWSGSTAGRSHEIDLVPIDFADPAAVARGLRAANPDAILHAGAISAAEAARRDPERAEAVNVDGTRRLADWCARHGRRLVFTSTDLVFDGSKPWNREDDPAEPLLAYGRSKRRAEPAVLAAPRGLAARVSLLYGPSRRGRESYFDRSFDALRRGEPRTFFADEYRTPLDLATAATILVRLVESDAVGLLHVGGRERMSRHELMRRAATALGLDAGLVLANRQADVSPPEPRPADVSLDTSRLSGLLRDVVPPSVEAAIHSFSPAP